LQSRHIEGREDAKRMDFKERKSREDGRRNWPGTCIMMAFGTSSAESSGYTAAGLTRWFCSLCVLT
jgi:hypothetical protein